MEQIHNYTEQENKIWATAYSRILSFLGDVADETVMIGIRTIGLPGDRVPNVDEINEHLAKHTDWRIVPLEDMVDDTKFISMLAEKLYPCRTWVRSIDQVDKMEDEYDIFHDVFGHTSLLYLPNYCLYLEKLGELALKYIHDLKAILYLKRVYWHTIQYGLMEVNKSLRIYGAHMITSRNEASYALNAGVPKYDHNVSIIMDTPYVKNHFQEKYFVIKSYDQLLASLEDIKIELEKRLK